MDDAFVHKHPVSLIQGPLDAEAKAIKERLEALNKYIEREFQIIDVLFPKWTRSLDQYGNIIFSRIIRTEVVDETSSTS